MRALSPERPALITTPHHHAPLLALRGAVATHEQLVSKSFQGRHGRAFLFTTATNVMLGPKEERVLMTGLHSVSDIFCSACSARLGWKYLEAFESRCDRGRERFARDPSARAPPGSDHLVSTSRACTPPRSQKYKEGKFIVEKSRIVEGEAL